MVFSFFGGLGGLGGVGLGAHISYDGPALISFGRARGVLPHPASAPSAPPSHGKSGGRVFDYLQRYQKGTESARFTTGNGS